VRFEIEVAPSAIEELDALRPFDRKRILNAIAELAKDANVEEGDKKLIRNLQAPWSEGIEPFWQVRVDRFRVFYDAVQPEGEPPTVIVRAIRLKGRKRTQEIL
jgi:mRNA-degrading endonuclease RelE of RelBE toxin-antitoxin system